MTISIPSISEVNFNLNMAKIQGDENYKNILNYINNLTKQQDLLKQEIENIYNKYEEYKQEIQNLTSIHIKNISDFMKLKNDFNSKENQIKEFIEKTNKNVNEYKKIENANRKQINQEIQKINKQYDQYDKKINTLTKEIDKLVNINQDYIKQLDTYEQLLQEYENINNNKHKDIHLLNLLFDYTYYYDINYTYALDLSQTVFDFGLRIKDNKIYTPLLIGNFNLCEKHNNNTIKSTEQNINNINILVHELTFYKQKINICVIKDQEQICVFLPTGSFLFYDTKNIYSFNKQNNILTEHIYQSKYLGLSQTFEFKKTYKINNIFQNTLFNFSLENNEDDFIFNYQNKIELYWNKNRLTNLQSFD